MPESIAKTVASLLSSRRCQLGVTLAKIFRYPTRSSDLPYKPSLVAPLEVSADVVVAMTVPLDRLCWKCGR